MEFVTKLNKCNPCYQANQSATCWHFAIRHELVEYNDNDTEVFHVCLSTHRIMTYVNEAGRHANMSGAKPLPDSKMTNLSIAPPQKKKKKKKKKNQWNCNQSTSFLIEGNTYESVVRKTNSTLSRHQYVELPHWPYADTKWTSIVSNHDGIMAWLSALLAPCEGNPSVSGGFYSQRASKSQLWCFLWFDPSTPLNKQWRCRWYGTPMSPQC